MLSSSLPPTALALALALLDAVLVALMPMAPLLCRLRALLASDLSFSMLTAMAAPTAASLAPSALPSAWVVLELSRWLPMVMAPAAFTRLPVPMRAMLSWLATVTATTGATAVPPLAPPSAVVMMAESVRASSVSAPLAPRLAPFSSSARLRWSATLIATDAPTPVFSATAPPPSGRAFTVSAVADSASSVTTPVWALTTAVGARLASKRLMPTPMASAPATLVLPPAAPEVALVLTVLRPVPSVVAPSARPWLLTVAAPTRALLPISATWMATAAPTLVLPALATPEASAVLSMSVALRSDSWPPVVMLAPEPTRAVLSASRWCTAMAAATVTGPSPLLADGVVPVLPRAPLAAAALLPAPCAALPCWSALLPFCCAPRAAALASLRVWPVLRVVSSAAPAACRLPSSTASTSGAACVTTTDAPTAASSLPSASPAPLASTSSALRASAVRPALSVVCVPPSRPTLASVFTTVTATTGATAVPPDAPPWASVSTSPVALAVCDSDVPVKRAPASAWARVDSSTTWMATEAPTPVLSPVAPSVLGRARAWWWVLLVALKLTAPVDDAVAPPSINASVRSTATCKASEPATATPLVDPAPDTARAPKAASVLVLALKLLLGAVSTTPSPSEARVVPSAKLNAAATPTPGLPLAAVPSASVLAAAPAAVAVVAVALTTTGAALVTALPARRAMVSPPTWVTATAAARFRLPSPVAALLLPSCVWPCVAGAPAPGAVAPPVVALAVVCTVRAVVAVAATLAPLRVAVSRTSTRVSPPSSDTATVPPTAAPLLAPAVPSARVTTSSVLPARSTSAPLALRLLLPATVTLAVLLTMADATEASLSLWLLLASGWVVARAVTLDWASSVSRPAVAVRLLVPLTLIDAFDCVCTKAIFSRLLK